MTGNPACLGRHAARMSKIGQAGSLTFVPLLQGVRRHDFDTFDYHAFRGLAHFALWISLDRRVADLLQNVIAFDQFAERRSSAMHRRNEQANETHRDRKRENRAGELPEVEERRSGCQLARSSTFWQHVGRDRQGCLSSIAASFNAYRTGEHKDCSHPDAMRPGAGQEFLARD